MAQMTSSSDKEKKRSYRRKMNPTWSLLLKDYFTSSRMSFFEITRSAGISPQIIDITSVQAITIITILGERFEKYANSLLAYVAFTLRKRMQRNEIITPVRAVSAYLPATDTTIPASGTPTCRFTAAFLTFLELYLADTINRLRNTSTVPQK